MKKMVSKKTQKILLWGIVIAVVLGLVGYFAFVPQTGIKVEPTYDYIEVQITAKNNSSLDLTDDLNITWYRCDITDKTLEEIQDLTLASFTSFDTDEKISYESKYIYLLKISGSYKGVVYQTVWYSSSAAFEGALLLKTGLNLIEVYQVPSKCSFLANPVENGGETQINQTDYRKWEVRGWAIDSEGKASSKLAGYQGFYNFTDGKYSGFSFVFTFNTTVSSGVISWENANPVAEAVNSTSIRYTFTEDFVTGVNFKFSFSSGLGNSYEVISMALQWNENTIATQG